MIIDPVVIDVAIAVSMIFMAFSLTVLVTFTCGVLMKGRDTLGSIERLSDTLQQEVGPTAVQLREVMDGITQLKGVTTQRITAVSHQVETAAGSVAGAVDSTKKHSTVLGVGLIAGLRSYLYGHNDGTPVDKQITMEKGDRHELK